MSDKQSLYDYSIGVIPTFADIQRRLFLSERQVDTRLPDHYYLRSRELTLQGITAISALLSAGLYKLSASHLELIGSSIYVKSAAWEDWQELLTLCSPLVCISAVLWKERFTPGVPNPQELAEFMARYIEPNTKYTCLPYPLMPQLQSLLKQGGLYDLHVHLNGATETDVAWQVFLQNPFTLYKELCDSHKTEKVREQIEQESGGISKPLDIYRLLCAARRVRWLLVHAIFSGRYTPELDEVIEGYNIASIIKSNSGIDQAFPRILSHPMMRVFTRSPASKPLWSDICLEVMMYILVMDRLEKTGDDSFAIFFHYYLLTLGFINRFLVQQLHQRGFDQFQKITLNNFREAPEKTYKRRFFQMHGNELNFLSFIEGRFAAKDSGYKNIQLVTDINRGWEQFVKHCKGKQKRVPELRLVCHFIKKKDNARIAPYSFVQLRHRSLRIDIWRRAQALVCALDSYADARKLVTGVDAAANELDAPPEVFAPAYRYLRRRGLRHFTFHAGEDFHHVIGGLRSIYEAVEFLNLKPGDRIGHGTAAGIDPAIWLNHIGEHLILSEGEWLDDLLFVLHFLEKYPTCGLNAKLAAIRGEVESRAENTYCRNFSVHTHIQAWLLRRYCPFHLLYERDDAMGFPVWAELEWLEGNTQATNTAAIDLLRMYHRGDCRKRYHRKVIINPSSLFSSGELRELQNLLLRELHQREVVLEVLPTSNVRISFYKGMKEHHIWRWLNVADPDAANNTPAVVLGTDDTGIFMTNIHNEYAHVFHQLVNEYGYGHDKAIQLLRGLALNSATYAFNQSRQ